MWLVCCQKPNTHFQLHSRICCSMLWGIVLAPFSLLFAICEQDDWRQAPAKNLHHSYFLRMAARTRTLSVEHFSFCAHEWHGNETYLLRNTVGNQNCRASIWNCSGLHTPTSVVALPNSFFYSSLASIYCIHYQERYNRIFEQFYLMMLVTNFMWTTYYLIHHHLAEHLSEVFTLRYKSFISLQFFWDSLLQAERASYLLALAH